MDAMGSNGEKLAWQSASEKGLFSGGPMKEMRSAADLLYGGVSPHPHGIRMGVGAASQPCRSCSCKGCGHGRRIQRPARRSQAVGAGGRLRRSAQHPAFSVLLRAPHGPRGHLIKACPLRPLPHRASFFVRAPANQAATSTSVPRSVQPCSRLGSLLTPRLCLSLPSSPGRIVAPPSRLPESTFPRPPPSPRPSSPLLPLLLLLLLLLLQPSLLPAASPTGATGTLRRSAARCLLQLSIAHPQPRPQL